MTATSLQEIEIAHPRRRWPRYPSYTPLNQEWLRQAPSHWNSKRFKFAVALINSKQVAAESELPYIGMENIESTTGRYLPANEIEQAADGLSSSFRSGDVLFGKLRPYLAKAFNATFEGLCSSELLVFRPHDFIPKYLFYLVLSDGFVKVVDSSTYGAKMPRASWEFIGNLIIPLPPLDEQRAIAAFLDRETARIDELIAKKQRLIELLKEKRQAVISRAVTKGLNPTAPMKPSGIDWLGDVPEHWTVLPIKYIARIGNGSTPSRENTDYWLEGHYPWLNSSVVNLEAVTEAEQFVTEGALRECHLPRVMPPAVLVGITGEGKTRGMATMLLVEATINQHLAYVKPNPERCSVFFLRRVLDVAYGFLRDESDGGGSTKGAITCEQLGNLAIPLPPMHEQREIVRILDAHNATIAGLMAKCETAVTKLNSYRSALITAAVTGQIDVRQERREAP